MKKNKYTKLLMAGIAIPVVVSALPTDNVFASENDTPKLNVYKEGNTVKLNWSTEMLKENIITSSGFEPNDDIPNLVVNQSTGQQEIVKNNAYSGLYSLYVGKTTPNLGNSYYDLATSTNMSEAAFKERKYIENNKYLSINMKVKTDKEATIIMNGRGGPANTQITFQQYFESNTPFTFKEAVKSGQNYFYVTNPVEFKKYLDDKDYLNLTYNKAQFAENAYYVAGKKDSTGNYPALMVKSVDVNTGRVELVSKFTGDFNQGENVLMHRHVNPLTFTPRTVENTNGEWETITINAYIDGHLYGYDTLTRGLLAVIRTISEGNTYIDDVKFGYATEVEVFRDNKSLYRGYLSDFEDTDAKDKAKPNKVQTVNTSVSDDLKVKFNPTKPSDNGTIYAYTIQGIADNGTRSAMSQIENVEVKTSVKSYKYSIDSNEKPSSTLSNTTTDAFNLPLSTLNIEKDYLHIQAVDENGNVSDVQTFKLKDIINTSSIKDVYDELNTLEDTMNYVEFVEFLDELESVYGANLPQDIVNRIEQLAKYHDVNTSFLMLLEGDFSLQTRDITSFGKVKLTAEKQVLKAGFVDNFIVVDARGTQQGWKVNVSATPFIEDTFEGFIGEPTQLPLGTLALTGTKDIQQVGNVANSQLPKNVLLTSTIIDSGEVTVLNAKKGEGMGEFNIEFSDDSLSMVVDSTTAKIDNVNYPEGITPYTSTITWNLITGP